MSQQEDDLRSLAKIMDLLRGLSIIVVVANIYWFCHSLIGEWQFHPQTMKVLRGGKPKHGCPLRPSLFDPLRQISSDPLYQNKIDP